MPPRLPVPVVRRAAAAVAVLTLAGPLSACTAGDRAPAPTPSASVPSAADAADAPPVATGVGTLADSRGTVDVAVRSLTLDPNGTTMTLRVDFTPHLTDGDGSMTLSMINDGWFVLPVLLDRRNLKRYSVVEGEGAQDWLTNKDARTRDGEPLASWFVFAAPEDDVDELALTIDEWGFEAPRVPVTS